MDFEDQEDEQEGDLGLPGPNYNDTRPKPIETTPPPPQPPQQQLRKSRYRECLKNHAVSIGGHAVDGCGEFIPAGEDGTLESLKCAACNCHRNFHRKEIVPFNATPHHHHQLLLPHHHHHFGYRGGPSGYLHVAGQQRPLGQGLLALPSSSGGGGADDQMEDNNNYYSNNPSSSGGSGKKRVRTKFTQEQKDRMLGFAERLGWRIQKQDEEAVQQFCGELGIKRHVLKVWMHNNKHTLGKKVLGGGGTNYTTNSES